MNRILFDASEVGAPLALSDPRARHLLEVLHRGPGEDFDAGLIDGAAGKGRIQTINTESLELAFTWGETPPALAPLRLLIGLPRPQTARKILNEAATLGVGALDFVRSERGEASYGQSSLWHSGEWRRHLIDGAQQAFCTRLPALTQGRTLEDCLADIPEGQVRLALDNYESPAALAALAPISGPAVLAIGSERGWSPRERTLLRDAGFSLVHLGPRVLRVETACIAATTLLLAKMGRLDRL